jgi:hypothetical protein
MITYTSHEKKIQRINKQGRILYRFTLEMPHQTPSTKMAQKNREVRHLFLRFTNGLKKTFELIIRFCLFWLIKKKFHSSNILRVCLGGSFDWLWRGGEGFGGLSPLFEIFFMFKKN